MNAHPPGRFDRRTAEQLLRGERVRGVDGELSGLLDAAAAPPRESQVPGERAALAAFRAARRAPASQPRPRYARTPLLRRHLWIKLAAAIAAVLALSGTAAAVTGVLPVRLGSSPPTPSSTASPSGRPGPPHSQPTNPNHGPGSAVQQLCHLYTANSGGDHGPTLNDPAFGPLVQAAGGKDNVPAYCSHLPGGNQPEPKPDTRNDTTRPKTPSPTSQHNDQSSVPPS